MNQKIHRFATYEPQIGERVFLADGSCIIGRTSIGDDSAVFFNTVIRADVHEITIGSRTNIQDGCVLHVSDSYALRVGSGVVVGHNVNLHACQVGDNCTIGMGSILLDGAVIGPDSIVGAGSLVTKGKVFPPRSLIMGNPARFVRELTDAEISSTREMAEKYVRVKDNYLATEPQAF